MYRYVYCTINTGTDEITSTRVRTRVHTGTGMAIPGTTYCTREVLALTGIAILEQVHVYCNTLAYRTRARTYRVEDLSAGVRVLL